MPKPLSKKKSVKNPHSVLAARVAELEDRDAIRSLINDMNWLADEGRMEELLDCFTDDVVYDVGAFGVYRDKKSLRGFFEQTVKPFSLRLHYVTNQVIENKGNRAKCRSYWKAELILQDRALNSSGHYLDELVKKRGAWKVSKRTATITYMCPLEEGWAKTRMMTLG